MAYDTNFGHQKLQFHPREVTEWLQSGLTRGPLYTEMELTLRCNHKCSFCGVDFQVNQSEQTIDRAMAERNIADLADMGNKSIMFAGNGEALLHPNAAESPGHSRRRVAIGPM